MSLLLLLFVDLSQVHQACYGVPKVPKGPWFCRTCKFNVVNPVSPVAFGTFNLCIQFLWIQVLTSIKVQLNFNSQFGSLPLSKLMTICNSGNNHISWEAGLHPLWVWRWAHDMCSKNTRFCWRVAAGVAGSRIFKWRRSLRISCTCHGWFFSCTCQGI
jgi:hypothetical protein